MFVAGYLAYSQDCKEMLAQAYAFEANQPSKSLEILDSLAIQIAQNNCAQSSEIADILTNTGVLYEKLKQKNDALWHLTLGLKYQLKKYDSLSVNLLPFYENLFNYYRRNQQFDSAKIFLSIEGRLLQKNNWKTTAQIAYQTKRGTFHKDIGELETSEIYMSTAKNLSNQLGISDSIKGSVLIESATLHTIMGKIDLAEQELEDAIDLLKESSPYLYSRAVDRMGKLLMEDGNLSQSEGSLLSNISFKKSNFPKDSIILLESLNNLGCLYFRINDLTKAEEYFKEVINISAAYKEAKPYGINNLGSIYLQQNKLPEAEKCFRDATKYFEELFGVYHQDYANALSNFAATKHRQGEYESALSLYTQVLELDKLLYGAEHTRQATSLTNLAHVYAQMGYLQMAKSLAEQSNAIKKKSLGNHHHLLAKSFDDLGLMQLANKDTLAALQSFDSALQINISHIRKILPVLTEEQRILAFSQIRQNLRRFTAISLDGKYFYSEWADKAINHTINTKGILFYASGKMHERIGKTEDLQVKGLYLLWKRTNTKLASAYLLNEKERIAKGISIEELEEEFYNIEKRLAQRVNSFHPTKDGSTHWHEISDHLNETSALVDIIEYTPYRLLIDSTGIKQGFVEQQSTYVAFIIKPNREISRIKWNSTVDFNEEFNYYRNALKYNIPNTRSYSSLWQPIDKELTGYNKVYLSPDGGWHKINPRVIYDFEDEHYVLDKYDIINITNSKDLLNEKQLKWNNNAIVIGDPDFSAHQTEALDSLPGAKKESIEIAQFLSESNWFSQSMVSKEATERTIKVIENPGILHIATHGFFNENHDNPLINSGLYLSQAMKSEDGKLTAYEAMNLNLDNTLLVTLSACETGLGKIHNGEGVYGLQRAFLVAGASNLIISLFKIDDAVTLEFMKTFYSAFLQSGDIQQAFFTTQKMFRETKKNPMDWGAFTLITQS